MQIAACHDILTPLAIVRSWVHLIASCYKPRRRRNFSDVTQSYLRLCDTGTISGRV